MGIPAKIDFNPPLSSPSEQKTEQETELVSEWYILVVAKLFTLKGFRNDPDWISRQLLAYMDAGAAADCVALLKKKGIIDDSDQPTQAALDSSQQNHSGQDTQKFHYQMIDMAKLAMEELPVEETSVSTTTLALSTEEAEQLSQMIQDFLVNVRHGQEKPKPRDRLFQLNLQLFPISK